MIMQYHSHNDTQQAYRVHNLTTNTTTKQAVITSIQRPIRSTLSDLNIINKPFII